MLPIAFALRNFGRRQMSEILQEKNRATRRSLEERKQKWLQLLRITITKYYVKVSESEEQNISQIMGVEQ